jgi:N-methylhydantoinase A/oxoprolinase/acetone carboxylase beta subunit
MLREPETHMPPLTICVGVDSGGICTDVALATTKVETIKAGDYEAVAIGLRHSDANPAHEVMTAQALRAALPDMSISISSVVSFNADGDGIDPALQIAEDLATGVITDETANSDYRHDNEG